MHNDDITTVYFTHMTNAETTVLENIWRQNVRRAQLEFLNKSFENIISSDIIHNIAQHLERPLIIDARKSNHHQQYILEVWKN